MDKIHFKQIFSAVQQEKIQQEFSRTQDICYLDHAGATLYSERQIADICAQLTGELFGNPHTKSTSSKHTQDAIDQIRYQVLEHFNTTPEEYSIIFTSGTTAALKLLAESFQYGSNGTFAYLEDNHTSVLGMRELAPKISTITVDQLSQIGSKPSINSLNQNRQKDPDGSNSLFVYPAQCNFSGVKYPLDWIELIQDGALIDTLSGNYNWFVCLDAAAFVATNFLDLDRFRPDYVTISFYKIFGYPTGLGALLVRKGSEGALERRYFGGGTVLMALSSEQVHIPRLKLHEKLEDGTIDFLSICALRHGFATLKRLSLDMQQMSAHVFHLAEYVHHQLAILHHFNHMPAAILYNDTNYANCACQGGIVNFNLLRSSGDYIGYAEVLHVANLFKIHLRTGCFCNPGACKRHLNLTDEDVKRHFLEGHVCGDDNDLIAGTPTGSVRISFGYMSTQKDADMFLEMISECFVEQPLVRQLPARWGASKPKFAMKSVHKETRKQQQELQVVEEQIEQLTFSSLHSNKEDERGVLEKIFIYPIKSCGAVEVENWTLETTGLKYDRNWMIVNSAGVCVTQKTNAKLCLIRPRIRLDFDCLEVHFEGFQPVRVPLQMVDEELCAFSPKCQSKVCEDRVLGWDCGDPVANWLSEVLQSPGLRLLRQMESGTGEKQIGRRHKKQELSLSNQAQFLLINKVSVEWLQKFLPDTAFHNLDELIARFRPNLVVNFKEEFIENGFREIDINGVPLKFQELCTRCQMICIDQRTGNSSVEPLRTISKVFSGKIKFGIYLSQNGFTKGRKLVANSEIIAKCN